MNKYFTILSIVASEMQCLDNYIKGSVKLFGIFLGSF